MTHHDSTEHDLQDALHRIAAGVTPPVVPVSDDLARGRRRRRRTQLSVAAGAALAVAVVGLGTAVVPKLVSADSSPMPAPETSLPSQAPPTEAAEPQVREIEPSAAPVGGMDFPNMEDIRNDPDLNRYRDVLAEYLDPRGEHLEKSVSNAQSGTGSKGTKLAWTNAGETGMGMIQVTVSAGWSDLYWLCGVEFSGQESWDCRDLPAPRGLTATVAEHEGVTEVAVEHENGIVVVLAVDLLFGNNSTVPVSGIDLGEELLAQTAADPRLDLPGYEGGVPPSLDQKQFAKVGRQVLLADGESLDVTYTGIDSEPWVQGEWASGPAAGTLSWQAFMGEDDGYSCSRQQFVRCAVHTVGSAEIFVGDVRAKWGGGWQVSYAGASYELLVMFKPATDEDEFPLERAFAFVTDPRWQPTR